MNEKSLKDYLKLFLLLFIITSLCLPGRALAVDIGSFVTTAKNIYDNTIGNTISKAKDYKNAKMPEVQNKINGYKKKLNNSVTGYTSKLAGIKDCVSGISLPSIKNSVSNTLLSGIKNSVPSISLNSIKNSVSGISFKSIKNSIYGKSYISGIKNSLSRDGRNLESIINSVLGTASTFLKGRIPKIALTGIKGNSKISNLPQKSGNVLGAIPPSDDTDKVLNDDVFKINIIDIGSYQPSNLRVIGDNALDVEILLNNISAQQYYIDEYGFVLPNDDDPVKVKNSPEYSYVLDKLINGEKRTYIYLNESMSTLDSYMLPLDDSYLIAVGGIQENDGTNIHQPDTALSHEATHAFRFLYNITAAPYEGKGISDEEGCTISGENLYRYRLGIPLRGDGSPEDDINKDGKPDGVGSFGYYYYSKPNCQWLYDHMNSTKK